MQEFFDAIHVYTFGAGSTLPDGSTAPRTLPDGTPPTYSTSAEGIHGTAAGGLTQEVAFPSGDLGFGTDFSCWDDFDPNFSELDPNSPLAVAQDAYHRLNTQRGLIPDDSDYGKDVKTLLQRAFSPNGIIETKGQIKSELLKDDRIDPKTLQVNVTADAVNQSLVIDIKGYCTKGPFSLILNASDSGVLLKSITGNS